MKIPPFYISSRGHSATAWLATMLSKHPEIVCFHGTRSIPPKASGLVPDMTPEQFVDALITCSENSHGKIFGAIHGFYGLICKKAFEEKGGRFTSIIRQPIKRIHSCFIHSHKKAIIPSDHEDFISSSSTKIYDFIKVRNLDKVLVRKTRDGEVMVSDIEKIFYHYCKTFIYFDMACIKEMGKELSFRMEVLVASKQEFERFFTFITQDKIDCELSYMNAIDFKNKINPHANNESPEAIYSAWPTSFKYLFHRAIADNQMDFVYKTYADMGYSLPQKSMDDFNFEDF